MFYSLIFSFFFCFFCFLVSAFSVHSSPPPAVCDQIKTFCFKFRSKCREKKKQIIVEALYLNLEDLKQSI